jgi:hypothetical protein
MIETQQYRLQIGLNTNSMSGQVPSMRHAPDLMAEAKRLQGIDGRIDGPAGVPEFAVEPSSLFSPRQGRPVKDLLRFQPNTVRLALLSLVALAGVEGAMPGPIGSALGEGVGSLGSSSRDSLVALLSAQGGMKRKMRQVRDISASTSHVRHPASTPKPEWVATMTGRKETRAVSQRLTTASAQASQADTPRLEEAPDDVDDAVEVTGTAKDIPPASTRAPRATTRYSEKFYPFARRDMVAKVGRALTPTSGDSAIDALVAIKPVWPRSLHIKYTILRGVDDVDQVHPWHADEVVRRGQPDCKIAVDADWAEMIRKVLGTVSAQTPFNFVAAKPGETADLLVTQTCFSVHGPQAEVRSPIYHNLSKMQFDAREDLPGLVQEQIDSPLRGVNLLQFDPQKFRAGPGGPGSEAWWGIQHEVLHTLGLLDLGDATWNKAGETLQHDLQRGDMTNMAYGFERGDAGDSSGRRQYPQTMGPLDLGAVDFIARNLEHDNATDLYVGHVAAQGAAYRFFPNGDFEQLVHAPGASRGTVLPPAQEGHVQRSMVAPSGERTTYDFSAIEDPVQADLSPGGATIYAPQTLAQATHDGMGSTMVSRGNIMQPRMTQEPQRFNVAHIKTGRGDGRYIGNAADNTFEITPGTGHETISGAAGKDSYLFCGRKKVTITDFTLGAGGDSLQIDSGLLVHDPEKGPTLGKIQIDREPPRIVIEFLRGGRVELRGVTDSEKLFAHNLQLRGANVDTQPAHWSRLFRNATART